MTGYLKIDSPTTIPVPGNKVIEEFIGRVHNANEQFSVARMIAPSGWEEGPQQPAFDEVTIMIRGRLHIVAGEEEIMLKAGEVFWAKPETKVRYSNPNEEECEYWALCVPAFSSRLANRLNL